MPYIGEMGGRMIDWARVVELRLEIGEDDFAEVVDLFLEETDEIIARLSANPDRETLGGDLHFLKGSALNLGFADLAALCQKGERQAGCGEAGQIDVAAVVTTYHATKRVFTEQQAQSSAA